MSSSSLVAYPTTLEFMSACVNSVKGQHAIDYFRNVEGLTVLIRRCPTLSTIHRWAACAYLNSLTKRGEEEHYTVILVYKLLQYNLLPFDFVNRELKADHSKYVLLLLNAGMNDDLTPAVGLEAMECTTIGKRIFVSNHFWDLDDEFWMDLFQFTSK